MCLLRPSQNRDGKVFLTVRVGVSFSIQLLFERMSDHHSTGCVGQCDLRAFYDSVPALDVARWLLRHGFDRGTALAVLRFTACLPLRFSGVAEEFTMNCRSSGVLTDTRTASAMGRILVSIVVASCYEDLARTAYQAGDRKIVLSSWVDNLYVAATSPVACSAMLRILEVAFLPAGALRSSRAVCP